jgi:hypothetical protein
MRRSVLMPMPGKTLTSLSHNHQVRAGSSMTGVDRACQMEV